MGQWTIGKAWNHRLKNSCSCFSIFCFHSIVFLLFLLAFPPVPNVLRTGDALAATLKAPSNFRSKVFSYYVDVKAGNDDNAGTETSPFQTIQKAADVAKPGDNILIKEGVCKEFVTIKKSGTTSNRITFEGERGPNGEYKTIIDPSITITGWSQAREVGKSVYKKKIGFDPREMTVDDKRIGRINNNLMGDGSGFQLLAKDSNAVTELKGRTIKFWDGIEAMYGYKNGITYIRFRNNDNPNEKSIKASPLGVGTKLDDISNVTIRNILIRGVRTSIKITGSMSSNNIIEKNYLMNGAYRVFIANGPSENIIRKNRMTMNYYAPDCLGVGSYKDQYNYVIRRYIYHIFKYTIGISTSDDCSVRIINPGDGNEISDNHIFGGLIGIRAHTRNVPSATNGLRVHKNTIHNMSSVGITSSQGILNAQYYDNLIYDCNINIRIHDVNDHDDLGRRVYIYRNRLWNPPKLGTHIYVWGVENTLPNTFPEYYIYHNSFSGGYSFINIASAVLDSGNLPKTYIINNIISAYRRYYSTDFTKFGMFDYNWMGGSYPDKLPIAPYENNIMVRKYFWNPENLPTFESYGDNNNALNSGLDLSQTFTYKGTIFGHFPGMSMGYFSGNGPSIGAVQF